MDIKRICRRLYSSAGSICLYLVGSLLILQGCVQEDGFLPEGTATSESIINDSKVYFESLVLESMENTDLYLENTLSPGEFTPLWDDAYASSTNKHDYIHVPIASQYRFIVRKNVGSLEKPKTRHVVAEQIISFRRSKTTGGMQAVFLTFVPTAWYFDRNKNNVVESFYSNENNGNYSGYILYNEAARFALQFLVKYEDGKITGAVYRNRSTSTETFTQLFLQMTGNDAFTKSSRLKTKSSEEDNDVINGGFYTGDIDVIGNYVPDCEYDHDPWGNDHLMWEEEPTLAALEKIAGYVYFTGINKDYYTALLANALNRLLEANRHFKLLVYDQLVSRNIRINFKLDPSSPNPAYYNPADKTIYFKDANAISEYKIPEEMFHAMQDYFYSGGILQYSTVGNPNIEMEAKIFLDAIGETCCSFFGTNAISSNNDWIIYQSYLELIHQISWKKTSTFTTETYNYWLGIFRQYNPAYNKPISPDFTDTYLLNYLLPLN